MKILDRYIMSNVLIAIALIILVLLGVENFVGLASQFSDVGKGNYNFILALQYVLLLNPIILYEFFPIACLVGCLVGLGGLASTQQLVVMRASGVSIAQMIRITLKVGILLSALSFFLGEYVAPQWAHKATMLKEKAMGRYSDSSALTGIWLKQGDNFIHINTIISASEIQGIIQYVFAPDNKLQAVINSTKGHLVDNTWHLDDSTITEFSEQKITQKAAPDQNLMIKIKPNLIAEMSDSAQQKSIKGLFQSYRYRQQLGLDYASIELVFWQKLLQPLTVIVMLSLGIPFVFGSLRDTGMAKRLLIGGFLGFGFYMLNKFSGYYSIAVHLPPLFAAILPMLVFALLGLVLLRRVE